MSELTPGHATPEGTRRYADRSVAEHALPREHFRTFDSLTFSSLGMGTYLGHADEPTDTLVSAAVERSITSGSINVIDSAANYRGGHGERSIGRALGALFAEGKVRRDEVFLATKNGYGADPRLLERLVREEKVPRREVFSGCNCMSPPFLKDQLERSRQNLGIATLDLLYLHNVTDEQVAALGPVHFLERLRESFEFLEEARDQGLLRCYGLATWDTFRSSPGEPGHLALEDVTKVARSVGGEANGFRFIQFPLNPRMPEAVAARTQSMGGTPATLLESARALGIGTFSSVPLLQGRLPVKEALQFARSAPGHLAPLVGHKDPRHVQENLAVTSRPPWTAEEFRTYLEASLA